MITTLIHVALILIACLLVAGVLTWICSQPFRVCLAVELRALANGCRAPGRRHGRRIALDYLHTYGPRLATDVGVTVAIDYDQGRLLVRPNMPGGSKR